MNNYEAIYGKQEISVEAGTQYQAQQIAQEIFQRTTRKAVKGWDIALMLTHIDGKEVTHSTANL